MILTFKIFDAIFLQRVGCHIENTQTDRYTRILPLSTWSKEELIRPNKLMLMIRAKGVVLIPLLLLPATPGYDHISKQLFRISFHSYL